VVDYVLVHELAHLIEIGHGPRFYRLVDAYPKAERARGYLLGAVAGAGWAAEPDVAGKESAYEAGADEVDDAINEVDDAANAATDTPTDTTTEAASTTSAAGTLW